jgi:hypothetical protein
VEEEGVAGCGGLRHIRGRGGAGSRQEGAADGVGLVAEMRLPARSEEDVTPAPGLTCNGARPS